MSHRMCFSPCLVSDAALSGMVASIKLPGFTASWVYNYNSLCLSISSLTITSAPWMCEFYHFASGHGYFVRQFWATVFSAIYTIEILLEELCFNLGFCKDIKCC